MPMDASEKINNSNKIEKTALEKDMENRYAHAFKKYMLKNWFNIKDSEKHLLNENTDMNEEHAFEKLLVLAFYLNNGIVMFHGDGEASFLSCTDLLSMNDCNKEGMHDITNETKCDDKSHLHNCLQDESECVVGRIIRSEATLQEPNLEDATVQEPPLKGPKSEESISESSIVNETALEIDLKELEIFEKEMEKDSEIQVNKHKEKTNSNKANQMQDVDLEKELNKLVSEMS